MINLLNSKFAIEVKKSICYSYKENTILYQIIFYENKYGKSEVKQYLFHLKEKADKGNKDARIHFCKTVAYIDFLQEYGTRIGEPVTKYLDGKIWELRPLNDRILYAYYKNDTFILLHHFKKKTGKIPRKELEQAIRNLKDYKERFGE